MTRILLLVLMLACCAVACDEDPVGPTPIRNVTWKLESVTRAGSAMLSIPNPDSFTVRFENNSTVAVRADCNSCTGRYTLDGSSVSIGSLACTLVACPTPGVDQLFTAGLENARTATVTGNQMVMSGPDYTLRFRN
jgi:heat shock protein HslJ